MTSDTRSGSNLVGAMLERRYRIDAQIARGGMSTVYRGLDTRLDRPVAIKVMDAQYSGDRSFVERFEREARAAASLHHPSIVAVYDQGVDRSADGDHVFLVMQLVEGCTLRDLIVDDGRLPLPTALAVIEPVLSALAAAHDAGMVHRDVKPENVLIGTDGSVKVADFGLVRAAASAGTTSGSVILGTVAYLSPEQVTTGAADARTDVYAAGIVLYEMLTGRPPYVGDTAMSVAYRHVNDDVPPPGELVTDLPPAVDDLVVRATRRDEQQRPADARALLTELERVRTDLGIALPTVRAPATAVPEATQHIPVEDPPTAQLPAVNEPAGPRGTRAMQRPTTEDDSTQELAAIGAGPDRGRAERGGKRRMALWTIAVIVLAALVGGAAFWLGSGRYTDVPPVVGEQEQRAQEMLAEVGLTAQVSRETNDQVPEGVVISSAPEPGGQVSAAGSVDLVVSTGKPRVPDIREGTTVAEAESALRDAELVPKRDESSDMFHTSVPEGRVIGVNPPPGTPLNSSSEVALAVSKGPPPVPVPDVRGMGQEEAFAQLSAAGFEPVAGEQRFDSDVPGNHVIATDPSGGTEVRLQGTPKISVVLSNAVQVPDLNGASVEEAQQAMAERGLRLEVQSIFERQNARILGQLPLPGSSVEPGSVVRVTAI